ncbi:MAG TPA: amino acid adenylation domain-containing protein [Herpetosiphonaceae bacterium]
MAEMTVAEFLAMLQGQGIKFRVEGERLRYRGSGAKLTPELHAAIAERKAEILAALQHENGSGDAGPRPLPRDGALPLSFAQQRLWFLDQLQPNSPAYNIHEAIALSGPLDIARLERSFTALVARHESLRTTFTQSVPEASGSDSQPIQRISAPEPLSIPLHDLQALSPDAQMAEVRRLAFAEAQQPFDLHHGPLLRIVLLRRAANEHVLLVTMHHIISDGWSMGVFIRELTTLYVAGGAAAALPPLPIQYADYAVWQRQRLSPETSGGHLDRLLDYWRRQLADAPMFLDLPIDRPRPAVQSFGGATVTALLDARLTADLKALSQRYGATLFMTLLTALQIMLARHTGQNQVVVGTPIAGRTHKELESLIGFFINTLALRGNLSGNPTFAELLGQNRTTTLDAFTHQDLPFEQLIDALHPVRDLSRQPLVQVMFALQNAPMQALELPGLTLRPLTLEESVAKLDLALNAVEQGAELRLDLQYSTDLFEAATIARMMEHLTILLRGIVANPNQRIAQLPLLTPVERRQLLHDWNSTPIAREPERWIHEQIAEQAARTPAAIAVIHGAEQITYAELDRRANQLAQHLRRRGIAPELVVSVCLERSIELFVAMLAILKAGGTYLPLDPEYPTDRLRFMLDDTRAALLIARAETQARLSYPAARCLDLDADWPQIATEPETPPSSAIHPDNLAYLIYTSGSTGRPKGVGVSHAATARHVPSMQQLYEVTADDRETLFMSPSFDVSVEQILLPLRSGACSVVRDAELWSPAAFTGVIRDLGITIANIPLIFFRAWIETLGDSAPPPSLRMVVTGAEALTADVVQTWQQTGFRHLRLINAYGPTETTITATTCHVTGTEYAGAERINIPIGRPVGERSAYILDQHGQPAPLGVTGELYLGGPLLARGYYERPALTAERFLPDPFANIPGARLYRTGDLARYLPDGNIEFLGRVDHQVKLRGFRIELGEIEAAILRSDLVREAVVLLREDEPGNKRLVAYVTKEQKNRVPSGRTKEQESLEPRTQNLELSGDVLSSSPAATEAEARRRSGKGEAGRPLGIAGGEGLPAILRALLAENLPEYMVPSAFVVLDELPLTGSGKLDRRALPRPGDYAAEAEYIAPTTALERTIAEVWQAVLKVERIGIHDNFFDRGGHSLLATQVVSRLRDTLEIEIPLRALFEKPTIAGMSQRIESARQGAGHWSMPDLRPVSRDGRLPLSFAQQRLWFLDQLEPGNPFYNMHVVLELTGRLDRAAVERSLNAMIARHESMRTTFALIDSQPAQVITTELTLALPVVDLRHLPAADDRESEALRLAAEEVGRPFDLQRGPLVRAKLFQLEQDRQIVVLTLHHIISDGWSMGVMVRDLFAFYRAHLAAQAEQIAPPLAPLPVQYADFAVWQRDWLQGEVLQSQIDYWKQQLADLTVLELPTDRPRPPVLSFRGATRSFELTPELSAALLRLSQQEDVTLFMTLLAGFQILMARYSGQTDIAVGSPIANRTRSELEDLIGFFVNMLVLRTDLSGAPTVRQLLRQVRDVSLSAYAHQDLPFEMLVEELQPERSLSYNPLFQVGFALQNAPMEITELPDLQLRSLEVTSRTATFDLSVFMGEGPNGIGGILEYNTDLFDEATIARLIGHFSTVLAAMAAAPEQAVTALPLLTTMEQEQLAAWNDTAAPLARRWVPDLFAAQAARTPDAIALIAGQEQLSYAALNAQANQLAHHLRALGAGPGVRIGLCVDRSPELAVGLLGIWKAGAAYVPLDPEYPRDRLEWMLSDADVALLVTKQVLSTQLNAPQTVYLDRDQAAIAAGPEENPEIALGPDTLAYVIYTSGSTGLPKGVMVEHGQLANTLSASQAAFQFTSDDRMPCIASFSFDIALFELFCPLLAGGSAVLLTKQQILDLPGFARTLESITVLHTLPSLMRQIAGYIRDNDLQRRYSTLRQIFVGGDAVAPDLLAEIHDAFPGARINILYGPTEATIICATHAVQPDQILSKHLIGTPMHNSTLRLYDLHGQLVPIGVAGELYIGGASVTRGYLHRPELTAEKFVELDNQRWYRTGDLARYLPDGTLEFLGRIDQQVKIRGFRIELGEIEAVLNEHPAIRDTAVIPRSDLPGDSRLVGYVVPAAVTATSDDDQSSYVEDWQTLYDETYAEGQPADPTFNITGWHSSYTGEPVPADEMRAWRDATVDRIRALQPSRVLEIGVGTGLLLFPLAGDCTVYHGIDFSAPALAHIRRHLPPDWTQVTLEQRRADDLGDVEPASFDTVILNSVAQYFPSADYLVAVITQALRLLPPDGRLFIGDVRSRPLLAAFATAVTLAQAAPDADRTTLAAQLRQLVAQERELLLDPAFFHALRLALPQISEVQVEIKRGHDHNELTQFRYDVTLTVDGPPLPVPASTTVDWSAQRWTLDDLRTALETEEEVDSLVVRAIPSARVQPLVEATAWLHAATGPATAGELRATLDELAARAVDPEALWALGAELGYHVRIGWSDSGADGCYDAVFNRAGQARLPEPVIQTLEPWSAYTTTPAATRALVEIAPRLRQYLQTRLPEHMIPSAFVVLDTLPLTPNGKVDRGALPAPVWTSTTTGDSQPRTPIEMQLSEIWQQVLGAPAVGIHDNFFALGGHSLLATQVISRIRAGLGLDLPVRALFEHPTIAELGAAVSEAQQRLEAGAELPPLTRRTESGPVPLSFAQQRLWFIEQLQSGTASYHVPGAWEIHGPLDVDALQHSLDLVVDRHESLRTTFAIVDEQPMQWIADPRSVPINTIDLSALDAETQALELERQIRAATSTPFDLVSGPLIRPVLLRRDARTHVFVLTLHHIITDGWSMGVLISEIIAVYIAAVRGQSVNLPPLPIQYADYAIWQRSWLKDQILERQLDYWRHQLAGIAALQLPTDHPRPALPSFRGETLPVTIDGTLLARLRDLSQQTGTTLFMILLSAWQMLLARYSRQDDIAVGTPIAGRTHPELEPLIGFFINTLVLRTDLSGDPTFRELLARTRTTTLEAYAHQDAPFEAIVEALQPERDRSRTPLFQVMFAFISESPPELTLPEIQVEPASISGHAAKFDLSLSLFDTAAGVGGTLEYAVDLFEHETIARLLAHFQLLLERIAEQPDTRIGRLPLLSAAERQQLVEWNQTAADYSRERCVHELIAAQAARTPGAAAVEAGGESLSYAELDCRANQLARHLQRLGVGPETRVALLLPHSFDLLIALLGIWKAGGAYVPLDPNYPRERLQFLLHDSQAVLLLTKEALREALPPIDAGPRVVCLDADQTQIATYAGSAPASGVFAGNAAYVIYTSGSTGQPKGVVVTHESAVNYLCWFTRTGGAELNHLPALTKITFDPSLKQLFGPLLVGKAVWLLPDEVLSQPALLVEALNSREHAGLNYVPSLWSTILDAVESGYAPLPTTLKSVFVGGEQLPPGLVARSQRLLPDLQIWNLYGPTEATVNATAALVRSDEQISIGRPIDNTQTYVLDRYLQPVPLGVPGELYIGGAGVARGYLNRPELTAERFVPDPFTAQPGARLYKTGDLARYLPDGNLDFLGRIDHQIKLRGYRIELGEIEAALLRFPLVRDAIVLLREDRLGDQRLVAYVTEEQRTKEQSSTDSPSPAAAGEGESRRLGGEGLTPLLQALLAENLPEYMVPSAFVVLAELPTLPNGKLDRRALPAPEIASATSERPYVAPRTPTESALAEIWQSLLEVEQVSVDDQFFRLGGHSLLAIRLMEQIHKRLGQRLPVAALFEEPTIAHLAQRLEQRRAGAWSPLVPIKASGSLPPLFCVHGLGGSVLNYAALAQVIAPEQPLYGLQAAGLDEGQTPHTTIREMAASYVQALRAQQPHGPYYLSGWSLGGSIAFEIAAMLHEQGERVALLALLDSLPERPTTAARDEIGDLRELAQMYGIEIEETALHGLSLNAAITTVLEQARRQSPQTWQMLDREQLLRIVRLSIAQRRALDQHRPRSYAGPIVLFTSDANPGDPVERRAAAQRAAWSAYVTGEIESMVTPGSHWTMLDQPNVQTLGELLTQTLAAARISAAAPS